MCSLLSERQQPFHPKANESFVQNKTNFLLGKFQLEKINKIELQQDFDGFFLFSLAWRRWEAAAAATAPVAWSWCETKIKVLRSKESETERRWHISMHVYYICMCVSHILFIMIITSHTLHFLCFQCFIPCCMCWLFCHQKNFHTLLYKTTRFVVCVQTRVNQIHFELWMSSQYDLWFSYWIWYQNDLNFRYPKYSSNLCLSSGIPLGMPCCIWSPKQRSGNYSLSGFFPTTLTSIRTYVHNSKCIYCISHIYLLSVSNLCVMPSEQAENIEKKRRRRRRRSTKKQNKKAAWKRLMNMSDWVFVVHMFTVVACCCCFCYGFYCRMLSKRTFLTQIYIHYIEEWFTLPNTGIRWQQSTAIKSTTARMLLMI